MENVYNVYYIIKRSLRLLYEEGYMTREEAKELDGKVLDYCNRDID